MLGLPLIDVCALEYVCMFNCRDVPFGAMTRAHTCTYVRVRVCVCVCVFGCVCALMFVYVGFRGLAHVSTSWLSDFMGVMQLSSVPSLLGRLASKLRPP